MTHDAYTEAARGRLRDMGFDVAGLHEAADPVAAVMEAEAVFVGGGNTFVLLRELYETGALEALRERALGGMPYMGSSAGSNLAGLTVGTTNDMPIVEPPSFDALALVPFQINPHYMDPDPDSTHKGETREQRLPADALHSPSSRFMSTAAQRKPPSKKAIRKKSRPNQPTRGRPRLRRRPTMSGMVSPRRSSQASTGMTRESAATSNPAPASSFLTRKAWGC